MSALPNGPDDIYRRYMLLARYFEIKDGQTTQLSFVIHLRAMTSTEAAFHFSNRVCCSPCKSRKDWGIFLALFLDERAKLS